MKIHTILLVLCLAFAGCTDGEDGGDAASTTSTTSSTTTSSTSNTTAPEPTPERLEASLSISPATVQVGGNVTFDFDATAFLSDGSEDNVTIAYSLVDLTGNTSYEGESGEGVPQAIVVAVNETGNHTFQLTVSAEGYDDATVTGSLTVIEGEPEFETKTYSCTTTAGAAVVSFSPGPVNVGGCSLSSGESVPVRVDSLQPADGCNVQFDSNGDSQSDGTAAEGTTYEAGVSFTVFCNPGTFDAESSMTVALIA